MYVSIKSICNSPEFKNLEIVAGKNGTHRNIKGISVSDMKLSHSDKSFFEEGYLFISALSFFNDCNEKEIEEYFDCLIDRKTAGLIYSNDEDYQHYISEDIIKKCDNANYPILILQNDTSYASIIATVNRYIAFENLTAAYKHIIHEIQNRLLSNSELHNLVSRILPSSEEYLVALCFDGEIISNIMFSDFIVNTLNSSTNVYAGGSGMKYYLMTTATEAEMDKHCLYVINSLKNYFRIENLGASRIHEKREIRTAINEATDAYCTACRSNKEFVEYSPLSTFQLLSFISDSYEAHAYYDEFKHILAQNCTPAHFDEMMATLKAYVKYCGDYKIISEKFHQHENTLRYRIHKLKTWLDMENDPIGFHEVSSIICKLDILYNS